MSIGEVMTLSARIDAKLNQEHLVATLTTVFSGLTLLLVSIGTIRSIS